MKSRNLKTLSGLTLKQTKTSFFVVNSVVLVRPLIFLVIVLVTLLTIFSFSFTVLAFVLVN